VSRTSWQSLVLLVLGGGLICFLVLEGAEARGFLPVPVPMVSAAGPALLAVVLLWLGRGVRRLVRQEATSMTPLGAARVVLLAKASSLVGSVLVGYFAAQVLVALDNLSAPLPREQAVAAGLALLSCLALVAVALLVEWWCRVPPDDEDDSSGINHGASAA
jgi:DMSO reductase anchor subunit